MGLRVRKSITLMPGVRLHLSRSGASLSAGVRGASVTMGPRGTYANVAVPGTGLYSRTRIGGGDRPGAAHAGGGGLNLPEIADLPGREATLAVSGRKLNIRDKSDRQMREEYARHVHGVALRIGGLAFATLPISQRVVVSGYSQRLDDAVGIVRDDYLFSVRFEREAFGAIDFGALERVDPVAAVARFDPVRDMTKTGIFRLIEPLTP